MRVLIRLSARADATYDNTYHHKLRGRLWRALAGTDFEEGHYGNDPPGFAYSNPFPPRDMHKGDNRSLLVASPHEELLTHIRRDLRDNPELNVGEMPFRVKNLNALAPDVGEPGSSGVIETGTGLLVRIPPWKRDEYGIENGHGNSATFWRPEHSMAPFRQQVENNLDQKHDQFCDDDLRGPSDVEDDLFNAHQLIKTFALPVTVTQGVKRTMILSKWRFGYTVRNEDHRRHLNLILDAGLGERNSLGFGFMNQQPPDMMETEQ